MEENISPHAKQWMVELQGDIEDLQDMCQMFRDPVCQVIEEEGEYFLCSLRFDNLQEARDVKLQAKELLPLLMSTARLSLSQISVISLGKVAHREADGSFMRFALIEEIAIVGNSRLRVKGVVVSTDGAEIKSGPSFPQQWLNLALSERSVAEALYFYSGEQTWFTLYKIYEIIEHSVGKDVLDSWWSGESEKFTSSANNATVSGPQARHSSVKFPKRPKLKGMNVAEAKQYIHNILQRWLKNMIQ